MKVLRTLDWETHLVERAMAGERVAFELLADLHRESLRGIALRVLRNSDDANDAVQETLIKAFRAIHTFKPGRPVAPWLSRICNNCCVDILRQRRHSNESLDKVEFSLGSDEDIAADLADSLDGEVVRRAVNRLPRHYREIVIMRHFQHMEVMEIAEALSKPEGTVKSWLFRARAMLRKDLEPTLGVA